MLFVRGEYGGAGMNNYEKGRWDMFELITSTWNGKQAYFLQDDGSVYSRVSCRYMSVEDALDEFLKKIWI